MADKLKDLAEYLSAAFPGAVMATEIKHGELSCHVARDAVLRVLTFLRDDPRCRFTMLCDICGVDYPDRALRFDVVYNLLSMTLNQRIRLKVETGEDDPEPSAGALFPAARGGERGAWGLCRSHFTRPPRLPPIP